MTYPKWIISVENISKAVIFANICGCNNSITYEGHPINRENFLIMQEFVPLEHGKCNH